MELNFLNIIVLFGGIQGITLCFFLFSSQKKRVKSFRYFLLFLLSLSIFNLDYSLIYMEIYHIGSFPLAAFPVPYKYLIGVGFYLYVRAYILPEEENQLSQQLYLFVPAVLYGILRLYWSFLILSGRNLEVIREVYETGFFTYNEFAYLTFNLLLIWLTIRLWRKKRTTQTIAFGKSKNWDWIKTFSFMFLGYTGFHFLIYAGSVSINLEDYRLFYYPTLINNSIFIYWIGFIGYTKGNLLIHSPLLKFISETKKTKTDIAEKLKEEIVINEGYKNPRLTVTKLATQIEVSPELITRYVNDELQMNFSQYLNFHRTQKVKELLQSDLANTYTIEALARETGFNSKSSFHKVFKEQTGTTPSAYRKRLI